MLNHQWEHYVLEIHKQIHCHPGQAFVIHRSIVQFVQIPDSLELKLAQAMKIVFTSTFTRHNLLVVVQSWFGFTVDPSLEEVATTTSTDHPILLMK